MSEEMYNIKEELQLIRAGHIIKWTFFVTSLVLIAFNWCKEYVPNTVVGHNFPYLTCSTLSTGIACVIYIIVDYHEVTLDKRLREERWREHNKKHK